MARSKIHRPVARYAGCPTSVEADSKAGCMKPLWRSRFSFFDFARSLTLSRYAASYGALEKHCQSSVGSLAMR